MRLEKLEKNIIEAIESLSDSELLKLFNQLHDTQLTAIQNSRKELELFLKTPDFINILDAIKNTNESIRINKIRLAVFYEFHKRNNEKLRKKK